MDGARTEAVRCHVCGTWTYIDFTVSEWLAFADWLVRKDRPLADVLPSHSPAQRGWLSELLCPDCYAVVSA